MKEDIDRGDDTLVAALELSLDESHGIQTDNLGFFWGGERSMMLMLVGEW